MTVKIALAQCGYPADGDAIALMERFAHDAASAGAELIVFPENVMHPRRLDAAGLAALAEPVDGAFANSVGEIARERGLWIVFTMAELRADGAAPYNTAVVVDDTGELCGSYRKCHLYDAHGEYESSRMSAGDAIEAPVSSPFGAIGLNVCYDLRFPEMARKLACAGAELLVYPAAWHDGPEKREHWRSLLRARAIENECFVLGAGRAGEGYVGASAVVDPLGRVLAEADDSSEQLVTCDIDLQEVARSREAMPVLEHRRLELY